MKNIGIKETLERLNTEFEGRDDFLSKDVLTTANQLNASRGLMFSSHLEQYVVLDKPDFPYVFTNYENEVGSYSSSFFKSNNNKEVVAKISKYENNDNVYILVTKDEDGVYDIIERKVGEELTENYAYLYKNDVIDNKTVGSKISKDEILYRSTSFDDDMNFMYGINANVCYMIEDRTIEDAIVCSESFSERMTSNYITEFSITLNNNDILCNLYGDKDNYKAFPDIGERNNSRVFVSMRRINYDSALFDLQDDNLRSINYNNDTKFYAEGELIDIEIRSNRSDLVLAKSKFNSQVVKYLHIERDYYRNIHEVLGEIISNPDNKFTNDLSFLYRKADDYLTIYNEVQKEDKNEKSVRWQNEKSEFDNFIITFKLLQKDKLKSGSKICNRFGSKGVISKILPDDQMPVAENGRRADVILNALGIVNRLNTGQLTEHELNFIAQNIIDKAKTFPSASEGFKYILSFVKEVNEEQYKEMVVFFNSLGREDKIGFVKSIFENGLYLHQPPFWNNVTFDEIMKLYKKYPWIKPYKCTIEGKEIEKPLIIAPMYMLKLKHQPLGKFSVRDTSYLNNKNVPSKNKSYKDKKAIYSNTPIRLGEMEISNLTMSLRNDAVKRMISMYASSETNRHRTVERLLTEENPMTIEKIETVEENHNREILDAYLKCLGVCLEN